MHIVDYLSKPENKSMFETEIKTLYHDCLENRLKACLYAMKYNTETIYTSFGDNSRMFYDDDVIVLAQIDETEFNDRDFEPLCNLDISCDSDDYEKARESIINELVEDYKNDDNLDVDCIIERLKKEEKYQDYKHLTCNLADYGKLSKFYNYLLSQGMITDSDKEEGEYRIDDSTVLQWEENQHCELVFKIICEVEH